MSTVYAYFLTWTCHGTWLHGDARGSVDRNNNIPGTPYLLPDQPREAAARALAGHAGRTLCDDARRITHDVIVRHCEIRKWNLLALNVRTNHVHVVVDCMGTATPERAMEQFKAWATRRLRAAGLAGADQRVWTEHGSTRWIDSGNSLERAVQYVMDEQ